MNIKRQKVKKPFVDETGRLRITLANDPLLRKAKQNHRFVHRLVAWEFCPNRRSLTLVVNHKDSDPLNNFYLNLEWCTHKENSIHGAFKGNIKVGTDHYLCKNSEEQVVEICELLSSGMKTMDIMHHYGFKTKRDNPPLYKLIDHIRKRRSWKQISIDYDF